jgi:glucose/arabinose dehydrogenase
MLPTALLAGLLGACGTPADPTPGRTPTPSAGTTAPSRSPAASESASPTGTASRPASPPPIAEEPPPLALELVASGLASPINVATVPDGRLLVNERGGRVITVDPSTGATDVALDIGDRVLGQGEQGLLGLALDPRWPEEQTVFVHYTDRKGRTVLSAFTAGSVEPLRVDAASEVVLLELDQPFANHNGGQVAFGPDGMLHLGLGDGGSGGDPFGHGQDPDTLLGSILRLDVTGRAPDAPYAIPADNPFADGGGAPEVFLFGLRNPWRFSFDSLTGQLWIGDVGQNAFEEISRVDPVADAGRNLGWNVMEASHCFAVAGCSSEGLIGPVSEYGRDAGCSVTGGYVYRGTAIDRLAGWYLFGDYCTGLLFGIPSDVTALVAPRLLLETGVEISSFGEDADGELYVADLGGGALYRIVPG